LFQAALKVARRVAGETPSSSAAVSIPSVAWPTSPSRSSSGSTTKSTLVIGAGEMAEETLRYLQDQGARQLA